MRIQRPSEHVGGGIGVGLRCFVRVASIHETPRGWGHVGGGGARPTEVLNERKASPYTALACRNLARCGKARPVQAQTPTRLQMIQVSPYTARAPEGLQKNKACPLNEPKLPLAGNMGKAWSMASHGRSCGRDRAPARFSRRGPRPMTGAKSEPRYSRGGQRTCIGGHTPASGACNGYGAYNRGSASTLLLRVSQTRCASAIHSPYTARGIFLESSQSS